MEVVLPVVAVVRGRPEDRGEVKGVHPQLLEVGELLADPLEVPPENEVALGRVSHGAVPGGSFPGSPFRNRSGKIW